MANIAKRADGRRWRARYRDAADQERARHFSPQGRRPAVARGGHHLHGDRELRRPEDGPDHRGGVDRHLAAGIRHAVRLDGAAGARARGTDRGRVRSHAAGRRAPVAGEGVDGRAEGRGSGTVVRLRAALAAVADPRRRRSRRVDRPQPVLTADVARRRPAAPRPVRGFVRSETRWRYSSRDRGARPETGRRNWHYPMRRERASRW